MNLRLVSDDLVRAGISSVFVDTVDSTQDYALKMARSGAVSGTVTVARRQTAGRGRMGRPWLSPDGGLYASVVFRPRRPVEFWPGLTVRAGYSVVSSVRNAGLSQAVLKWPNDCLVGGRKLCGLLAESFPAEGFFVLGIGMNIAVSPELENAGTFSAGYDAVSLLELGNVDAERFCVRLLIDLLGELTAWDHGRPFDIEALSGMLWTDGEVTVVAGAGTVTGQVKGVDSAGRLVLVQPDQTEIRVLVD